MLIFILKQNSSYVSAIPQFDFKLEVLIFRAYFFITEIGISFRKIAICKMALRLVCLIQLAANNV